MADLKTLQDLLNHEVQVLYSAEKLIIAGLPRMIEKANNPGLVRAFTTHLKETEEQRKRLKQVAELLGIDPDGDASTALKGLIAEGEKAMHKDHSQEVMDATLIACAQKIEHYEISGYGTAAYLAEELGHSEVAMLLRTTLEEEQKTDTLLNNLAKSRVNPVAEQISGTMHTKN